MLDHTVEELELITEGVSYWHHLDVELQASMHGAKLKGPRSHRIKSPQNLNEQIVEAGQKGLPIEVHKKDG